MSFFKDLFGKGEPKGEAFVPTPTKEVPGIPPIVVQAIENLYSDVEDQKKAFKYSLEYLSLYKDSTRPLLAILSDTHGNIQSLPSPALWSDAHFNFDLMDIFPKMKNAEEWVKSITKPKI